MTAGPPDAREAALRDFRRIPGVGKAVSGDLWALGLRSVEELRGRDPEELYERLCELQGMRVDPAEAAPPRPAEPPALDSVAALQAAAALGGQRRRRPRLMRQPAPAAVCSPADQAKLDELMSTTYTREDFHPSTGAGLFDAIYAPGDGAADDHARDHVQLRQRQPGRSHLGRVRRRPGRRGRATRRSSSPGRRRSRTSGRRTRWRRCMAHLEPPLHVLHAEGLLGGQAAAGRTWTSRSSSVRRPARASRTSSPRSTSGRPSRAPRTSVTPPGRAADQSTAPLPRGRGRRDREPRRRPLHRRTPVPAPATARSTPTTRARSASRRTSSEPSAADKTELRTFGATLGARRHAALPGHDHRPFELRGPAPSATRSCPRSAPAT